MRSAIIKIAGTIVLNKEVKNDYFKQLYLEYADKVQNVLHNQGLNNWDELTKRFKSGVDKYETDMTEMFRSYIPIINKNLWEELGTEEEKNFETDDMQTRVLEAEKGKPENLQIALTLITKPLTLIDSTGSSLLLAIGDKTEELKSVSEVKNCFLYNLNNNRNIFSYKPIELDEG